MAAVALITGAGQVSATLAPSLYSKTVSDMTSRIGGGVPQADLPSRPEPVMNVNKCDRLRFSYGQFAFGRKCVVHDGDGNNNAVRWTRLSQKIIERLLCS